jgi:hypothetical protein
MLIQSSNSTGQRTLNMTWDEAEESSVTDRTAAGGVESLGLGIINCVTITFA